MIDTIKISLDLTPSEYQQIRSTMQLLPGSLSPGSSRLSYAGKRIDGMYSPRLTLHHFSQRGQSYLFLIEFSIPKMVYGNNIEEVSDEQYLEIVKLIQGKIHAMTGLSLSAKRISKARVSALHVSKNILLRDYTSCLSIITAISKLDIHGRYDIQKTDFRPGHALHIHSDSQDVIFYDKIADINRSNIGKRRSVEYQRSPETLSLISTLELLKPLDIFRYEMRLSNRRKIKSLLPDSSPWDFQSLFNSQISKQLLESYWLNLTNKADFLGFDSSDTHALLASYIEQNPNVKMKDALATTTIMQMVHEAGYRRTKQVIEKVAGKHTWQRFKPLIRPPNQSTYRSFKMVSQQLAAFEAVRLNTIDKL